MSPTGLLWLHLSFNTPWLLNLTLYPLRTIVFIIYLFWFLSHDWFCRLLHDLLILSCVLRDHAKILNVGVSMVHFCDHVCDCVICVTFVRLSIRMYYDRKWLVESGVGVYGRPWGSDQWVWVFLRSFHNNKVVHQEKIIINVYALNNNIKIHERKSDKVRRRR